MVQCVRDFLGVIGEFAAVTGEDHTRSMGRWGTARDNALETLEDMRQRNRDTGDRVLHSIPTTGTTGRVNVGIRVEEQGKDGSCHVRSALLEPKK